MGSVSEKFVSFIKDTFFVEQRYIIQQSNGDKWSTKKKNVTRSQIQDHFNGNYYIGFVSKNTPVNFFVFDLDRHNGESLTDLTNRVDSINAILGRPNIISASPRNGFHNYYFLDKNYPIEQIKSTIQDLIPIFRSSIELFPSGKGLRLFGGKNCPLLSNTTLQPVASTPYKIEEYFTQVWTHSERLEFNKFIKEPTKKTILCPYKYKTEINDLLNNGLKEEGTRNPSLIKLNWAIQTYDGLNQQEAESFMLNWIATKNNNKSKDWRNDPDKVVKEIKEIAKRYDPSKVKRVKRFPLEKLSFEKILIIQDLANDISKSTDLDAIKVEEFLQYLISYGLENHDNGLIDIPSSVFKACKNGSRARYIKYKSALIDHGILTLVKNYSTVSNKCATYRIRDDLLK